MGPFTSNESQSNPVSDSYARLTVLHRWSHLPDWEATETDHSDVPRTAQGLQHLNLSRSWDPCVQIPWKPGNRIPRLDLSQFPLLRNIRLPGQTTRIRKAQILLRPIPRYVFGKSVLFVSASGRGNQCPRLSGNCPEHGIVDFAISGLDERIQMTWIEGNCNGWRMGKWRGNVVVSPRPSQADKNCFRHI